ncbi:MAG TPA: hypothetical protein VJ953_18030 [Saprospiraceae bacterium]|nr:hypothetical protein [Saprospiraceae bacterium]
MPRLFFLTFCLTFLLFACEDDPDTTPAEVVKSYQAYVDQNAFDKAAQLSTAAEAKRLKELAQMIAADADSSILYTSFEEMSCVEISPDTVECDCKLADQYERYSALFTVVRQDGEWLVDLPEPASVEYDSEIESLFDSLQQQFQEEN